MTSRRRPRASAVVTTSMSTPRPGWTLEAALDLLEEGYSPEQVERLTGYAARHTTAAAANLARPRPDRES